jgi:hypothetical protein
VTKGRVRNVAASVRQRLHDRAKQSGRPFQEVLQYFAMERFLYRLSSSPHAAKFVLKGALMLTAWQAPTARPTKDIDLLGRMDNRPEAVADVVRAICEYPVEDDGLQFDPQTIQALVIKEDADHSGVRVNFKGHLENARIDMQIDVGFADATVPSPQIFDFPAILDFPAPRLRGYRPETAIAEKFEAMIKLGSINSRLKDFYDIWWLAQHFEFEGAALANAVRETFAHRGTTLADDPVALTPEFSTDAKREQQWQAFSRRLSEPTPKFADVVEFLRRFLMPVSKGLMDEDRFEGVWRAPGPWESPTRPQ